MLWWPRREDGGERLSYFWAKWCYSFPPPTQLAHKLCTTSISTTTSLNNVFDFLRRKEYYVLQNHDDYNKLATPHAPCIPTTKPISQHRTTTLTHVLLLGNNNLIRGKSLLIATLEFYTYSDINTLPTSACLPINLLVFVGANFRCTANPDIQTGKVMQSRTNIKASLRRG